MPRYGTASTITIALTAALLVTASVPPVPEWVWEALPPHGDVSEARPPRELDASPRRGEADHPTVLYFYYGWYGAGPGGKNWRYGITDEPQAGHYSSHDLGNARHQLATIRDTGGDGIVHSWWGAHSFDEESLRVAVEAAEAEDVKITASFETWAYEFRDAPPKALAGQLVHLWHNHAQSPAWLRVDGKPVVFVHAAGIRDAAYWEEVFAHLDEQGITFHTYAEVRGKDQMGVLSAFDGAYYYMPIELQRDRVYADANREMTGIADEYGKEWLPTVAPAYDNTNDAIKRHHLVVDGEGGALFREAWENASRMDTRYILIGTWNEWNEGTSIEPGVADDGRRLALAERLIREMKGEG